MRLPNVSSLTSQRNTPITDALVRPVIPSALKALANLMESESTDDRDIMALASVTGGIALANIGLGIIHGFAGPLGSVTGAHTAQSARPCSLMVSSPTSFMCKILISSVVYKISSDGLPTTRASRDAFNTLDTWVKSHGILGHDRSDSRQHKFPTLHSPLNHPLQWLLVDLETDVLIRILEEAL